MTIIQSQKPVTLLPKLRLGTPASRGSASLRFANFLAPGLSWFYQFVAQYAGRQLGCHTVLSIGCQYEDLPGQAEAAFVCGLPYVDLAAHVEPLVAPVLSGSRYGCRPIYFSDVVVRRESAYRDFAGLRGCSWAFNEPRSQSGHGIVCYHLARAGEDHRFFGRLIQTGWHHRSVDLVCRGQADASAIDSHLREILWREKPEWKNRLRILTTLGPSPIQPLVVGKRLPDRIKSDLQSALVKMHQDPQAAPTLRHALVDKFVPVHDGHYQPIRDMVRASNRVALLAV